MNANLVSACFGLGELLVEPRVAAAGWGERNVVWRFETTNGLFAVKELIPELVPDNIDTAYRIENVAHAGGVPVAPPVLSANSVCLEELDGRWYRCHRWVEGVAKQNEDTTPSDAAAMGALVAHLHGLEIPAEDLPSAHQFGRAHWLGLARQAPATRWSRLIEDHLDRMLAAERLGASFSDDHAVGSHRDLNAHNVLFHEEGLVLIDWDAAGPESTIHERASTATLWAQTHDGQLDLDKASAFLRSYRDAGGIVGPDDPVALQRWLSGLTWWTERNVQIAITEPSAHHDELASGLVLALANGVQTIEERQAFLAEAIARL